MIQAESHEILKTIEEVEGDGSISIANPYMAMR
jgi:hypothetical protein